MVSPNAIRVPVGIIGDVISLSLLLAPIPTFWRIWRKGSVAQFSPVPYLVTFLNSMIWLIYALPIVRPNSTLLLLVNVAGCVIELFYLSLFVAYSNDKKQRLKIVSIVFAQILLVGLGTCLVLNFLHTADSRIRIVGIIGDVSCSVMYASPLSVMRLVIRTKSVEYMPFFLSLASFSNAAVWTIYGFYPLDPYIVAPSALGILLGLAQLILYAVYYKSTQDQMEARRKSGPGLDLDLAEVGSNGKPKQHQLP